MTTRSPPTVKLPPVVTVSEVESPRVTLPLTVKFLVTVASLVTDKSCPIVTSFGRPSVTVTSLLDLATVVSISFVVPKICKSSASKSTFCVVEPSASTVKVVATFTVPAAVNRPCASTVNVGI